MLSTSSTGYLSERGDAYHVMHENSALPVNHALGMQVKITITA
ncbi:hypothetical protein ACIMOP_21245 [Escherichia coli]